MKYLENCEWFDFVLWQPAYCWYCWCGVSYKVKDLKPILPKECSQCDMEIQIEETEYPQGAIMFIWK